MYMKLSKTLSPFPCAVYRASFPKTFKEMSKSDGHYKKVIPGVIIGMAIGILLVLMILHPVSRVPQGSVLGSLLFYIYIDDVSTISFSEGSTFNLFADDMFLYKVIKSPEDLI